MKPHKNPSPPSDDINKIKTLSLCPYKWLSTTVNWGPHRKIWGQHVQRLLNYGPYTPNCWCGNEYQLGFPRGSEIKITATANGMNDHWMIRWGCLMVEIPI
ncbi:hypothetical protein CDAR_437431 [Caerostris darwini]|uniref:Uncharacterized protein n=1 Tax=Caerostris darwini TaxID=1538125 RepID=A0AAV4NSS4_9ARAC|nr:hypothetical protein CDAR_437431 [Caerostris darwini]